MSLFRWLKRLVKTLVYLVVGVLLIPIIGLAYGFLTSGAPDALPPQDIADGAPPPALAGQVRAEIPGYQRAEVSTFLSYPEWAIVYAARDYAGFVKNGRESGFPYWAYIGRFWQDYATVIRASSNAPFNFADHQRLAIIGASHTIEHAIQWAYENTIGRVTEITSGRRIGVDRYQAGVAADYAAFVDQIPWYQFPYSERRAGLMEVGLAPGEDQIRTSERKLAFGLAYTVKQGYAALVRSGLAATADPASLDIHVWARGPVANAVAGEPDTELEKDFGADGAVFVTKRHQVLTDMIPRLVEKGVSFVEIGGNDEILVTVLSNDEIDAPQGAAALFAYQLPAQPYIRRTGLTVAVRELHTVLPALAAAGARLEHVYDY